MQRKESDIVRLLQKKTTEAEAPASPPPAGEPVPVKKPIADTLALFATPIAILDLPDMETVNADLATRLLAEEQTVPSWQRANVGGWHSMPDLGKRPQPAFRTLMRAVVDHVAHHMTVLAAGEAFPTFRYAVTAWATIMRDGHYVIAHDHGDVHWSVAYYVDAGDDAAAPSGRLAFLDPRRIGRPIAPLFPTTFELAPRTSALVIFPGWLQHYVHAYRGQRPRICISCNVTLEATA